MFEMVKQYDKLFKAIKIIRVKIIFMKTYIHSVKKMNYIRKYEKYWQRYAVNHTSRCVSEKYENVKCTGL